MGGVDGGGRGGLHGGKATSTDNKQQTNKQTKTATKPKQQLVFHQQALGTKVSRVLCSLVGGFPAPSRRSVLPPLRRCPAM